MEIVIPPIEFSIGHESVETGTGIFKSETKDTAPISDTVNRTVYVPSVQERVKKSIGINSVYK